MSIREKPYRLERNNTTGKYERVAVRGEQVRSTIMKAYGLKDEKEYRRFYDVMKNKAYTYNAFTKGDKVKSVQSLLYASAKSKIKYGNDYKPSKQMTLLQSMPAYSKSKGERVAGDRQSQSYKNVQSRFAASIARNMSGLINAHRGTDSNPSIVDQILKKYEDDPATKMQALIEYANKSKEWRRDSEGNYVKADNAFPLGSTAGSSGVTEFDFGGSLFKE